MLSSLTCAATERYRLQGQCRLCPNSDGVVLVLVIAIVVVIGAPVLFKLSEQAKNFPAFSIGRAVQVHPTLAPA